MWILKDVSIKDIVASLWFSVFAHDKLSNVFRALLELKQLLLGKTKDKRNFLSINFINCISKPPCSCIGLFLLLTRLLPFALS